MLTRGNSLAPKCGCRVKAYPSETAALRALDRIKTRKTRRNVPTRAEECWRGRWWHLVGGKPANTGPDDKTRKLVLERDGYRCACCGNSVRGRPYSLQHRDARGMGGTSDPETNSPTNLITLCGSATSPGGCHLACEQRDPRLNELGFWLWSNQDPAAEPVAHHLHGWVLLLANGDVQPVTGSDL